MHCFGSLGSLCGAQLRILGDQGRILVTFVRHLCDTSVTPAFRLRSANVTPTLHRKTLFFRPQIVLEWDPKGAQNRLKSAKMLPRTPPEWVRRPSLEKVTSRTLPETPICAENMAPAMVFTLPRGCPQAPFGLYFGYVLGAFWPPWAPKPRPRSEKDAFKKGIEKALPKRCLKVPSEASEKSVRTSVRGQ